MLIADRAKNSSLIALAYVLLVVGGIAVHFLLSGDVTALRYSIGLAGTWLVIIVGLLVSIGLWRHYRWAWWLGLVAAIVHVFFTLFWMAGNLLLPSHFALSVYAALALQLAFLWSLASRATYLECSR